MPNIEEITNVAVFVDWNYLSVKAENLNVSLDGNYGFTLRVRVDCKESETKNISFKWYKSSTKSEENLPTEATPLGDGEATYSGNPQSLEYSDYYENYYDGTYSNNDPEYYYCLVTRKYDYVGISSVEKVIGPFQINGQSGGQGEQEQGQEQGEQGGGGQGEQGQEQGEQEPGDEPTPPATLTSITATYSSDKSITRTKDPYAIQVPSASDFEITENYSDSTKKSVTEKTNYSVAWKTGVTTTTAIGAVPVVITTTKDNQNFTCEATVPVKYTIGVYGIDTTDKYFEEAKDDVATKTLGSRIIEKTWQLWQDGSPSQKQDSFTYSWKDEQDKPIGTEATYKAPLNDIGTISYTRTHTITPEASEYFDGTDNNSYEIVYQLTVTDPTLAGFVKMNGATVNTYTNSAFSPFKSADTNPVKVNAFYIAESEVTYQRWKKVYDWATNGQGYSFAHQGRAGSKNNEAVETSLDSQQPVTNISWRDAVVWCNAASEMDGLEPVYVTSEGNVVRTAEGDGVTSGTGQAELAWEFANNNSTAKNGYRLPTDVEWEFAARGGDPSAPEWNYKYTMTNEDNQLKDYAVYYTSQTSAVKSNYPNKAGLYDMCGNVMEFTDMYDNGFYKRCYARGGAYRDAATSCDISQSANRNTVNNLYDIEERYGFRLARNVVE